MKLKNNIPVLKNLFSYVYKSEIFRIGIKKIKENILDQGYLKKYGIINTSLLIINIKKINFLINKKKYSKAENLLSKAKKKWPDNIKLPQLHAKMTNNMRDFESTCKIWKEIFTRFPDDEDSLFDYIMSFIKINKIDTAYEICMKEKSKLSERLFITAMAYIYMEWYDWEAALTVLRSFTGEDKYLIKILEASIWVESNKANGLEHSIKILETLLLKNPESVYIKTELVKNYINAFRQIDALKLINELYKKNKRNIKVIQLYAWSKHIQGKEKKAKKIWNTLINSYGLQRPALLEYRGNLDRIDNNPLPSQSDKILLFTCIKNEFHRLPWFLKYYRKLGVDRFFFIDNGSNDGSTEFLKKQKDVHLFWTEYNYGKAGSGMQWINKLINIYGQKHWCIYLDVDEELVFPGIEERNLKYLINYMNKKGHEAFRTFMLDMYPQNTNGISGKATGDPIINSPYFDNNYQFFGVHCCPYIEVKGGIRNNLFSERVALTKTPIIVGNKGIKFINSSHRITPAKVSDVTGVLLHYKLMSDLGKRSLEEYSQKNRAYYCNQRHLNYKNVLDKLGKDHILINPLTQSYESSDQLIELGLMSSSEDFD